MVPNGWEVKKLDLIYRVIDSLHQTPSFSEDGFYPMIRVTDIKGKSLSLSSAVMVSEQVFLEYTKKYKPKQNDIVFSRVGSYGISAFVDTDQEFCLGQNTVIAESNDNANPIYIFNILKSEGVSKQIEKAVDGSSHKTVSLKVIKNLEILLPPKKEQQKIAQILSTWDKAIAVTEQLLANSQQQKKALMQQLLTGKKRLLDENGVRFEGEWKIHSLGSLGDTYTGLTGKSKEDFGSGKPYITYMNIFKNNRIDIKQVDYVNIHESENQNSVQYGDIFFTTSSETAAEVGMSAVLLDEIEELYLNSFCFGFRLHHFQIMHPEFAAYIFRSNEIRKQIAILGQGATRYNLSKNQLMKLELTLPNIEEQQKIAKVLSTSDQEIEALQHKLDCLQQEKKALMQQLLTGKRRVKVAA